jgi:hypothetical protein
MSFATSSLSRAEAETVSRSMLNGRDEASRAQSPSSSKEDSVRRLFVESWGSGVPVVLVHGSLATGADEWHSQRPLADEGFVFWCRTAGVMGEARRLRARTS